MSLHAQVQQQLDQEKAPEGTIIIKRGEATKLYNIEDLMYMNELPIGQLFFAIARHNGKKPSNYGTKWVKFRNHQYEVSNAFIKMKEALAACANDFERANMVADHLGEPHLVIPEAV